MASTEARTRVRPDPHYATMTPERIAALKASHAGLTVVYRAQIAPIDAELSRIEERALEIVRSGASISGYPSCRACDRIDIESLSSNTVRVRTQKYWDGGGYHDAKFLTFPTRWLSMPDASWRAELSAEVAATAARKAAAEVQRAEHDARRREAAERAELERLRAKYGDTP